MIAKRKALYQSREQMFVELDAHIKSGDMNNLVKSLLNFR